MERTTPRVMATAGVEIEFDGQPRRLSLRGSSDLRPFLHLRQSRDSWKAVKAGVEAHDLFDSMPFHNCHMNGVPSRQATVCQKNLFRPLGNGAVNWEHLINHAQQRVESRLNILAAIDGIVTVQNLLQNFGVGYEALALVHVFFQQALGIGFVRPRGAHKIHRDIGVDQDHGCPALYPRSISVSMVSMSPVGDSCCAAARIA